jgi:toxin-antitoxin system PIN domain toxin
VGGGAGVVGGGAAFGISCEFMRFYVGDRLRKWQAFNLASGRAHVHHTAALAWLDAVQKDGDVILCRLSQLGLLRLLNNPIAMGADVQSGFEAWKTWDAFLGDQRFRFDDEAEGFELHFRVLSASFAHQPKRWQHAYFAAFALAADAELVTFDTGFRSSGLCHRILAP